MNILSYRKHRLVRNAVGSVIVVILAKLVAHGLGWEILSLNPLFSGLIAANVFLMGFLLTGVLTDYKESEKLPGEIAAGLETMTDEVVTADAKGVPGCRESLAYLLALSTTLVDWLHKKTPTRQLMDQVTGLNARFAALEPHIPANFVARLKQEQSVLRRNLVRVHSIRETSFIPSGYVISELVTLLLTGGLILSRIDPFYESLFFVGLITFLFSYLGLLIRDLDNPFGYYESGSTEDVSIKPVLDAVARLKALHDQASACR